MNQPPLVSIIIPTYNDHHVVCDAIDCSLGQEHDNCEVIVVDDGSTDGTERLLKGKYGSRIKYIRQENKGLSNARNAGIRHASGKYIQFLDADDLIDQNKIGIQVKQLQNISGLALAYCDYVRTDINDMRIVFEDRINPVLQKKEPFDDLMMKWETELSIPHHCFLFDAAIFRSHGIIYDENLPNHEDWEFLMNVFALDPMIVFIDKKLANYRVRPDGMHTNLVKMRQGYLKGINKQIKKNRLNKDIVEKLKLRKKQIRYLYRDAGLLDMLTMRHFGNNEYLKLREEMRAKKVIIKSYLNGLPGGFQIKKEIWREMGQRYGNFVDDMRKDGVSIDCLRRIVLKVSLEFPELLCTDSGRRALLKSVFGKRSIGVLKRLNALIRRELIRTK